MWGKLYTTIMPEKREKILKTSLLKTSILEHSLLKKNTGFLLYFVKKVLSVHIKTTRKVKKEIQKYSINYLESFYPRYLVTLNINV